MCVNSFKVIKYCINVYTCLYNIDVHTKVQSILNFILTQTDESGVLFLFK